MKNLYGHPSAWIRRPLIIVTFPFVFFMVLGSELWGWFKQGFGIFLDNLLDDLEDLPSVCSYACSIWWKAAKTLWNASPEESKSSIIPG